MIELLLEEPIMIILILLLKLIVIAMTTGPPAPPPAPPPQAIVVQQLPPAEPVNSGCAGILAILALIIVAFVVCGRSLNEDEPNRERLSPQATR